MASSNRDLTIGLISKMDRFDLKDAANQLEDLGDKAEKAGKATEQGMEKAEKAVKSVASGDEARKLDAFFDKIGDSAKRAGREVDDGMDKAKKGVDEFKDEASQSGREAAASFSGGFDDVQDFIQETLANGLAGLGPIGAAAGIAAAAGIGFIANAISESKERVAELTQTFLDLRKEGIDPASDAASHMIDELDAATLRAFREDADKLGISYGLLRQALDGNAEAISLVRSRMREYNETNATVQGDAISMVEHFAGLRDKLSETEQAALDASMALPLLGPLMKDAGDEAEIATPKVDAIKEAIRDVDEEARTANLESMTSALREVGNVSGEMAAKVDENGKITIKAILDVLREQTKATINHQENLQQALTEGGEAFAAWMAEQPAAVAQAYVEGSAKERKAIREAAAKNVGAQMGQGTAEGLAGAAPAISTAANTIYNTARSKLTGRPILIPVGMDGPSAGQVDAVYRSIKSRFGTIEIPVVPKQFGQGRFIP